MQRIFCKWKLIGDRFSPINRCRINKKPNTISRLITPISFSNFLPRPFAPMSCGIANPSGDVTTKYNESLQEPQVPKLPLPSLQSTLENYLSAIEAVVTPEQFKEVKMLVDQFGRPGGVGETLQAKLEKIATEKDSWVYDWWLDDMYLKSRLPLPVNSNPGMVFPQQKFTNQKEQLRFAAKMILGILDYKLTLDNNTIETDVTPGKDRFPLCMAQHFRLLTSYRRPGYPKDALISTSPYHDGYHIIVALKGQFFEVKITHNGEQVEPSVLMSKLEQVITMAVEEDKEPPIGLMTAEQRDKWAKNRMNLCKDTTNENSLDSIERCLCIVCLDDPLPVSFNYNGGSGIDTEERDDVNKAVQMLHGGGSEFNSCNRWFDKTLQLIIGSDGVCGLCYEHSPAEGVAVIQLLEKLIQLPNKNDDVKAIRTTNRWPNPKRLHWKVDTNDLQAALKSAVLNINVLSSDLDFFVLRFTDYGREFAKSSRVSPDVYIQLALQLAYYKVNGHLASTYESAATRRFHLGRVDNIRAATVQALDWTKAMEGNDVEEEEKIRLFRKAVERQTEIMTSNIRGHGIDCHLLALRELVAEEGMETPDLFSNECYAISNQFLLSTSQVSTQTDSFMGYGAVVPEGYGCSYNLQKNSIIFCVASFKNGNSASSKSKLFARSLEGSLLQMKDLLTSTG